MTAEETYHMAISPRTMSRKVLDLFSEATVLRAGDLARQGITRTTLQRLMERGEIERVGRGLYTLAGGDVTEHHSFVEACQRVPQGVVCLLSALRFHDLTTQNPFEVWLAIPRQAWRPQEGDVALRLVYLSPRVYEAGLEVHRVEGVDIRVYSAAKTVADCFKFRTKVGLDVALEALRDYRRKHRAGLDELWRLAKLCRVTGVMRPYLEVID